MMNIDWNDIVSSYKNYVANNPNNEISFDEWLTSVYIAAQEDEDEDDIS